jgi:hypothetical protein
VREPDVVLFGVGRLDEAEQLFLTRSLLGRLMAEEISKKGAAAAAKQAFDHAHGHRSEFVLHVDLDVIASEDFAATNLSAPGGLRLAEVREALAFLVRQNRLAALSIGGYNPALDADGSAAKKVIELLADILTPRLEPPASEAPAAAAPEKTEQPTPEKSPAAAESAPVAASPSQPSDEPSSDSAAQPANDPPTAI